jgi:aspartokinase/homoserine dehydrogenase 1
MIVLKFGGTSVGSLERVRDAVSIIEAQPLPRAAVVSAAGGVTNLLLDAAEHAANGDAEGASPLIDEIVARHARIADGIGDARERAAVNELLDSMHDELRQNISAIGEAGALSKRESDRVVSIGERSMSVIVAATLRSRGTPAAHVFADAVIATDDRFGNAKPDRMRTQEQAERVVRPLLDEGKTVVMTGFIGGAPDGSITTLGRGGSDYSATLLGAALMADEVQIWTDVPGVLSADPRLVPDARVVPQISFDEAQELAHFGAKVLHPRTIRPAVALDIPVRILSTFAPNEPGTLVTKQWTGQQLKAITAMRNLLLLTVDVPELEDLSGAASAVFGALHEDRVDVVLVSQASSRRRMTYLIDGSSVGGCDVVRRRLCDALQDFEATVGCTEEVALVAAVGHGAAEQPRALSQLLTVLGKEGIPVLASSQQMSNAALVAAVPARFAERAVLSIHNTFIPARSASRKSRRRRRSQLIGEAMQVG